MRDKQLYQQIRGIESPWRVESVEMSVEEGEIKVHVQAKAGTRHRCPRCGGDDRRVRRWRHLDTCQLKTIIEAERSGAPYPGTVVTSPCGAWCEGGSISKFINSYVGGGNALSALHDTWLDFLPGWTSIPLMLPAAGVTYFGLVDTPIGSALIGSDIANRYGGP